MLQSNSFVLYRVLTKWSNQIFHTSRQGNYPVYHIPYIEMGKNILGILHCVLIFNISTVVYIEVYVFIKDTRKVWRYQKVIISRNSKKNRQYNGQYHPSGLKALWMILVSRDDTAYDTDFAMYYSLYYICFSILLFKY